MWIGTLSKPVTLPLTGALAINLIHVGGEGDNDCRNAVRIFAIREKRLSHACPTPITV